MTLLTGDFAIDSLSAEHRSPTEAKPAHDLPDDARLYLRHVEEGQSIRALARSEGCHASTILRRIRRFEARRDDPLVDGALAEGADRGYIRFAVCASRQKRHFPGALSIL